MNNLRKNINKIPKDFSNVFIFDVIAKVFLAIISIILIRFFSTQEYADYTKFSTLSNFIVGIFGTGIALSFVRFSAEKISREKNADISGLYALSSITFIIIFTFSFIFVNFLKDLYDTSLIVVVIALIYGFAMSLNRLNQFYYQAKEMYIKAGIVSNLRNFILFILIISCLIYARNIYLSLVMGMFLVSAILSFLIGSFNIYINLPSNIIKNNLQDFKSMLSDSGWLILYTALLNLFNQMDVLMLSNLAEERDVALYGVAFRYYSILLTLLPSIQSVLRVRTAKKEFIDNSSVRYSFTYNWIKRSYKIVIIGCISLILGSKFYMNILNGVEYADSIPIYNVLVIGVALSYLFAPNVSIMMSGKRYRTMCVLAFISFVLNVSGNYILIPIISGIGAAISTIISQGFLNITCTIIVILDARKEGR